MNPTKYNKDKNLFGHPNVVAQVGTEPLDPDYNYQTNAYMYEVLQPLLAKPWKFHPLGTRTVNPTLKIRVCYSFAIFEGAEKLGKVELVYSSGGGYKICVDNDRVRKQRSTERPYRTEDVKKATLMIRKNFYPMLDAERVDKYLSEVGKQLASANWDATREMEKAKGKFFALSQEFVIANMDLYIQQYPHKLATRDLVDKAKLDHTTIKEVCDLYETKKTIFVIRQDSHYIVKVNDTIYTMVDDAMPEDLRRKLGILKLVEDGQCVEGMGFRSNENVFLVTPETTE